MRPWATRRARLRFAPPCRSPGPARRRYTPRTTDREDQDAAGAGPPHLAERGLRVAVLEAAAIGAGASGRATGFVNPGLHLDPDEAAARVGPLAGPILVDGLNKAPSYVYELIARHGIDCDLVRKGVMKFATDETGLRIMERYFEQWTRRGVALDWLDAERARGMTGIAHIRAGIVDGRSATINPLAYVRGLARASIAAGAAIHEDSRVLKLEPAGGGWRAETARGAVTADKAVLATDAYVDGVWPGLSGSTVPVGCFLFATPPLGDNARAAVLPAGHAVYSTHKATVFARMDREHRLVVGCLGYLPGQGWADGLLGRLFPHLAGTGWQHRWHGSLGLTPDEVPRWHEPAPGLHAVLGYNGRGIGPGTFMGRMMAARVAGELADDALPLPVTPVRPVPFRALRARWLDAGIRLARIRAARL